MNIDRNFVLNLAGRSSDINGFLMTIYHLVVRGNYKTIVELGGGQSTYALVAAANKTDGQVYSHDFNTGCYTRLYPEGEGILDKEQRFHFIAGDDLETVKLWNKPIDFLFHDTSHVYDLSKKEIDSWFPFVRRGGQIFMHDTQQEAGDGMGCGQAIDEFMKTEEGKQYSIVHLQDSYILGASILNKL
mgnify:CR=1 FL=1